MIAEGTDPTKVTDEQRAGVVHQVELFCRQHRISRRELGRAVNLAPATISEIIRGTYKADDAQHIIDLDTWLEQEIRRRAAPRTTQFVWTSVAREIENVANVAIELGTIGLIYGPETSGIGKTMALQAIHSEKPGSIYVQCETIGANPTGLLRAIARAMGVTDGMRNAALYDRIVKKLRGTPRLLIIDQIHKLRHAKEDRPLFILSEINDATEAPQLWSGTTDMVDYLQRGQRKRDETLAQIRSRIGISRDLMQRCRDEDHGGRGEPLFTHDDIRKVFGANKVRLSPDATRFLMRLANLPDSGALRTCRNLVRIATAIAAKKGVEQIDAAMIRAAMQFSVSTERAAGMTHDVEDRPARATA